MSYQCMTASHWCTAKCWVFIGHLWCKITNWILQARATNTISHDCIPWKPAILCLHSQKIRHSLQQWRHWRRCKGANIPFAKLNVKTRPRLAYILIFSIPLVYSRLLCFLRYRKFLERFPVILGFSTEIHIWIRMHFHSTFSEHWQVGSLRWSVGLLQLHFPPWLIPLVTPLVYNIIFLNNFLLDHTEMLSIKVDSETLPTHLPAYPGICWQRRYPQYISQWWPR